VIQREIQIIPRHEKGRIAKVFTDGSVMIAFRPNVKIAKDGIEVAEGELWKLRLDESKNPYFKDDIVDVWCNSAKVGKWVRGRVVEVRGDEVKVEYMANSKQTARGEMLTDTRWKWRSWDDAASIRPPQVTFDVKVEGEKWKFLGATTVPLPNKDKPEKYLIQEIEKVGLIAASNEAETSRKVKVGDCIVAVNGERGVAVRNLLSQTGPLTLTLQRALSQEELQEDAEYKERMKGLRLVKEKQALKDHGLALGQLKTIVNVVSQEFNNRPCVVLGFNLETKDIIVRTLVSEKVVTVQLWCLGGEEGKLVVGQTRTLIQALDLTGMKCKLKGFSREHMRWETEVINTGEHYRFPAEVLCDEEDLEAAKHGRPKETVHKDEEPARHVDDQRATRPYLDYRPADADPYLDYQPQEEEGYTLSYDQHTS
jgi:hypothetical protein